MVHTLCQALMEALYLITHINLPIILWGGYYHCPISKIRKHSRHCGILPVALQPSPFQHMSGHHHCSESFLCPHVLGQVFWGITAPEGNPQPTTDRSLWLTPLAPLPLECDNSEAHVLLFPRRASTPALHSGNLLSNTLTGLLPFPISFPHVYFPESPPNKLRALRWLS